MIRMPPSEAFVETLAAYGVADMAGMSVQGVQIGTMAEALDKPCGATLRPDRPLKTHARSNAA